MSPLGQDNHPTNKIAIAGTWLKALLLAWVLACLALAFLVAGQPVIKLFPPTPSAFLLERSQEVRSFFTDHLATLPNTKRPRQ